MKTMLVTDIQPLSEAERALSVRLLEFLAQEISAMPNDMDFNRLVHSVLMNVLAEWMSRSLLGEKQNELETLQLFLVRRFAVAYNEAKKLV